MVFLYEISSLIAQLDTCIETHFFCNTQTPPEIRIFYFCFWSLFIKIKYNWLELLERWSCREHDIDYPEQLVILWHRRHCWRWSVVTGQTLLSSSVLLLLVYTIWHLWQYHHNTRPSFIISNVSSGGKIGKILLLSQLAAGAGTHSTEDCQGEQLTKLMFELDLCLTGWPIEYLLLYRHTYADLLTLSLCRHNIS